MSFARVSFANGDSLSSICNAYTRRPFSALPLLRRPFVARTKAHDDSDVYSTIGCGAMLALRQSVSVRS